MEAKDQVLFRYCDADSQLTDVANPNGATDNIAGVCNVTRNVFGMMPHPERASDPELGNTDGRVLFESMLGATLARI
jgi:phosphoribosylformylglycinamidine synthase